MEEEHVVPAQEETKPDKPEKRGFDVKKLFIGLGIVVFFALIGGGSYWFGTRRIEAPEPSPTPLPASEPSVTPEEEEVATQEDLSPTPSPKPSPSPTPTPTPVIKTKTITSQASLDGWRSSNGGGNKDWYLQAGRNTFLVSRSFVSFDLSEIPSGATITEATLRLYQYKIDGSPYGVGGSLKVDHLNYGDALDNTDYGMAALLSSFTTLTSNAAIEWKDADVTGQVKDDTANGRSRSQYRIHFTTEVTGGDVTGDFAYFESGENYGTTGKRPQLMVKYY